MAAIKNDRDIALQKAPYRSKQAAVNITADTGSFLVSKNTTTVVPSTITLTATPVGSVYTNNAVYAWSYCVGNANGTYTEIKKNSLLNSATANKLTLNNNDSWVTNPYVYYKCEVSEPLLDTSYAYYTITYTKEPQDPLTINLLHTNVLVTCDSTGTPINFNNTDQTITVTRGTTALAYSANTTTPNSFSVTYVASNLNVATGTGTGTSWNQPAITGLAQDGATITYTITVYDSAATPAASIYTKTVVYNKISNGVIGANGADGANLTPVINIDFAGTTLPAGVSYPGTVTGTDSSTTTSIKNSLDNQSLRLTNLSLVPANSYIVNMRVKWVSGTTWAAKLLYTNSAGSERTGFYKTIPQPAQGVWTTISLDMRSLTLPVNSTDYMNSTVTGLCFNFFSDTSSEIVIDYITVGKYGVAEATKSNTVSMYVWAPALIQPSKAVIANQTYTVTTVDSTTTRQEWVALFNGLTAIPAISDIVTASATGTLTGNSTVTLALYYTGAFTYTWSGGTASAYPTAYYDKDNQAVKWTSTAGSAPASGYILYQRNLTISDVTSVKTTDANWSSSVVNTIGYRNDGTIGSQGDSYRIAYIVTNGLWTNPTTPTSAVPTTVPGSGDAAPTNTVVNQAAPWSKVATSTLTSGQYMYQTDGIYSPATGIITWGMPYISNLKVGSLSAIAADLGTVTIASGGSLASGKTSASDSTHAGFFLGNDGGIPKFRLGNATNTSNFSWDGTTLTANSLSLRDSAGTEYLSAGPNLSFSARLPNTTNLPAENATVGADWKTNVSNIPYDKIFSNDAATTLGFNPSFEAWSGTVPDSWEAVGTNPIKETATVRFGTNAVKYTANNETSLGINRTSSWTNGMPVGSFVNGTVDFYLVAITSGLPGIIVSLYTDVGLTTSYSTLIQPNNTIGQWQRIPFTARVASASDLIYGIKVEVLASSSLFITGVFKGTVIFDSLSFGFFDSTIDNKQIAITSNGTLIGAGGGQVTLPGMGQNTYRVISRGYSVTNFNYSSGVYYNYSSAVPNLVVTATRSYTLTVITRSTGQIVRSATYDVTASTAQATALATALNACDSTVIVVVSTHDEPQTNRLQADLLAAMYRCGASSAVYGSTNSFKYRSAYILVGIGGCGQGNGAEAYQGSVDSDANAWCDLSFSVVNGQLTGVSGNYTPTSIRDYGYTGDFDATKGAPSGTYVAGVLAETVNSNITTATNTANTASNTATTANATANTALTSATTAKTAADSAAAQAVAALSQLSDIGSDSVLTPSEKFTVIADYNAITAEQAGIGAQATAFSITDEKTAYDTAVSQLTTYLASLTTPYLWSDTTTTAAIPAQGTNPAVAAIPHTTTIDATTFRQKFQAVYTAKQALLNAIYAAAKALSNTALSQISDLVSDSVLTPNEKSVIISNYNTITTEKSGIVQQASLSGVSSTTYETAVTTLTNYLATLTTPVLWSSLAGNTAVSDSSTFRTNFQNVYVTKQALLNAIDAANRILANTAQSAIDNALSDIANDNLLTAGEKSAIVINYNSIIAEQKSIDAQATTLKITTEKTAYDTAVTALTTYLDSLSTVTSNDWTVAGYTAITSTFSTKFIGVYTARNTLLNKIISTISVNANLSTTEKPTITSLYNTIISEQATLTNLADLYGVSRTTYTNYISSLGSYLNNITFNIVASSFNTYFSNVYTARLTLITAVLNILATDNVLSSLEKANIKPLFDLIVSEQSNIDSLATQYSITTEKTTYDNSIIALTTYLATLTSNVSWTNLAYNNTIDGPTFRQKFQDVYAAKQVLSNAFINKAVVTGGFDSTSQTATITGKITLNSQYSLVVGTPALDGSTGSNGLFLGNAGLYGTKDGKATFGIDATTGDSVFSGTLNVVGTGTSRIEVLSDKINVYNAGKLRVRLGNLT